MVNNQLKKYNKEGSIARRKNTFEKKKVSTRFCQVEQVTGQPGFAWFLLMLVFHLTRTGPTTGSTGSRVDLPGWSEFNNYGSRFFLGISYFLLQYNYVISLGFKFLKAWLEGLICNVQMVFFFFVIMLGLKGRVVFLKRNAKSCWYVCCMHQQLCYF
jgi:hypothetical protein